jgi:hypothetical protein
MEALATEEVTPARYRPRARLMIRRIGRQSPLRAMRRQKWSLTVRTKVPGNAPAPHGGSARPNTTKQTNDPTKIRLQSERSRVLE